MNYLSETVKAYIAGFIDGEGYIGIVRQRKIPNREQSDTWLYHPWVILISTDAGIIKEVLEAVSIGKKALQRRTGVWKDSHQLKITNHEDVVKFLTEIKPFLRIKRQQAELLIK